MKRSGIVLALAIGMSVPGMSQRYFTKAGDINFDASGKIEAIHASNKSVTCVIDTKTAAIQLAVPMKAFQFEKALMEEHFNENYIESDKYPKSEFKGQILNNAEINYTKDGSYPATIKGQLSIHGVTKDVEASGSVVIKGGKIEVAGEFEILLSDYNIEIPKLVTDNISKTAKIKVDCNLEPLKS